MFVGDLCESNEKFTKIGIKREILICRKHSKIFGKNDCGSSITEGMSRANKESEVEFHTGYE